MEIKKNANCKNESWLHCWLYACWRGGLFLRSEKPPSAPCPRRFFCLRRKPVPQEAPSQSRKAPSCPSSEAPSIPVEIPEDPTASLLSQRRHRHVRQNGVEAFTTAINRRRITLK